MTNADAVPDVLTQAQYNQIAQAIYEAGDDIVNVSIGPGVTDRDDDRICLSLEVTLNTGYVQRSTCWSVPGETPEAYAAAPTWQSIGNGLIAQISQAMAILNVGPSGEQLPHGQ